MKTFFVFFCLFLICLSKQLQKVFRQTPRATETQLSLGMRRTFLGPYFRQYLNFRLRKKERKKCCFSQSVKFYYTVYRKNIFASTLAKLCYI